MTDKTDIRVRWNNQITFLVGNDDNLDHKASVIAATMQKVLADYGQSARGTLNVRAYSDAEDQKKYIVFRPEGLDEAISKSFTLKDFDRQMAEMGYRVSFDPNRKYWTIIGKGWQRPKRLYKLGEDYTNERIVERIKENSYAVKFQRFSRPQPQTKVYRVKGNLKNAKKIGGLRGLYLHYCYKLGILPKKKQPNYARLHYLLKDDLMKMEAITQETRLLCRNHIDTAEQLCSYKGSLESEIAELTEQRKGLYSQSRKVSGEEKEAVKARLSEITERMKFLRKEVRLCGGIEARSDTLKEKLEAIRADEKEQKGKELMKHEHRRRSGGANRPNELGGI